MSSTGDDVIRVTVHHNWFEGTDERHPRLRHGMVHAYNNLLVNWLYYGMGSSQTGQLVSEANIFEAGDDKDAIITQVGSDPEQGLVRSEGEMLLNGAVVATNQPGDVFVPSAAYPYTAAPADGSLRSQIEAGAGWQDVPLP